MKKNFRPKKYSIFEVYVNFYKAFSTLGHFLRTAKKNKILDDRFRERIMLAVTEVNGCELCSCAHTRMALETGMTQREIQSLLSGN